MVCAVLIILPKLDVAIAQSGDYVDWEDCMQDTSGDEELCRDLEYTPAEIRDATRDDLLYDDWEDCIATETEQFCRRLGFQTTRGDRYTHAYRHANAYPHTDA